MCVCHVHWMDCKAAACSVSCIERVLPSLCQTHCCLTVTEDSTPMLAWTIARPFVQAAQKCCCQRARLMLLGNTTCCALVYSSSSSVLCVYTSPFSQGGGVEVVAVLIQSGLAKTAFLWQLCWYCAESCDAATWVCLHCECSNIQYISILAESIHVHVAEAIQLCSFNNSGKNKPIVETLSNEETSWLFVTRGKNWRHCCRDIVGLEICWNWGKKNVAWGRHHPLKRPI